jgi:hypothetical protein
MFYQLNLVFNFFLRKYFKVNSLKIKIKISHFILDLVLLTSSVKNIANSADLFLFADFLYLLIKRIPGYTDLRFSLS